MEVCKLLECWLEDEYPNIIRNITLPRLPLRTISNYIKELEKHKDKFPIQSDKDNVCPLKPLIQFPDYEKENLS